MKWEGSVIINPFNEYLKTVPSAVVLPVKASNGIPFKDYSLFIFFYDLNEVDNIVSYLPSRCSVDSHDLSANLLKKRHSIMFQGL